jgi:hypothetical protein
MTVVKEMKKIDMINMMLDNNYPKAWEYVPSFVRRNKTHEEQREYAVKKLQYNVLKDQIYEMFYDYLYWKIENN